MRMVAAVGFPMFATAPTILSYLTITFQNVLQTQTTDPSSIQQWERGEHPLKPTPTLPSREGRWGGAALASDECYVSWSYTVK